MVLVAPLCAFTTAVFGGRKINGGLLAITAMCISVIASIMVFVNVWNGEQIHEQITWFTVGTNEFKAGILLNNLSVLMMVLISVVALPVHIYSVLYMKGDPGIHRYWMYLSLFCFAMLALVMADSLLLMYICWELVGFASYLLIGFWFTKAAAIRANKKAFLINRVGDLGFLIGICIVYSQFQTLDVELLFGQQGFIKQAVNDGVQWQFQGTALPAVWLTLAGIAFFTGAMAKSAQFPFHIWLPDAMEGPTSVSSLIHAATMVAAGVFMLVRISPLFDATVLLMIGSIGAFTAFMAATIALTQYDIKKILAFSTISQLGFMMVAIGIGQYGVAMFHLVTHAFFKCLLFLAAGAIIHELHHMRNQNQLDFDPQDIRNMGGLRKYMPKTFRLTLIAALALAGLPLTAGYLSKDAILIYAFEWAEWRSNIWMIIPVSLLLTSALTAFYIARLVFKVFYGKFRLALNYQKTIALYEAPVGMRYPMTFLALCALFPLFSYNPLVFENVWLLNGFDKTEALQRVNIYHTVVPAAVNSASIIVIFVAWRWYARQKYPLKDAGVLFKFSLNQWYLDAVYHKLIVKAIKWFSRILYAFDRTFVDGLVNRLGRTIPLLANMVEWVDRNLVDGVVNGAGRLSFILSDTLRNAKSGRIQQYLFSMFLFFLIILFLGIRFF